MKSRSSNIQPYLQAHCQSHTSQRYNQSFVKELAKPTQIEFQNIFSSPSKKIKTPDTQTDTTMTLKLSAENGLQGRPRRTPAANRVACPAGKFRQGEALTPPYVRFSHTAVRKVMG